MKPIFKIDSIEVNYGEGYLKYQGKDIAEDTDLGKNPLINYTPGKKRKKRKKKAEHLISICKF